MMTHFHFTVLIQLNSYIFFVNIIKEYLAHKFWICSTLNVALVTEFSKEHGYSSLLLSDTHQDAGNFSRERRGGRE